MTEFDTFFWCWQVLADDDTKCQLNQEVEDLREAIKVTKKCSQVEEWANDI